MTTSDRIAKLRRMAEHPTANPHEAAIAREEIERLMGAASPVTSRRRACLPPRVARVRIDGAWLFVAVPIEHFEIAKDVMCDVFGSAGSIGDCVALYTSDPADRDAMADALRGTGFVVTVHVPCTLVEGLP